MYEPRDKVGRRADWGVLSPSKLGSSLEKTRETFAHFTGRAVRAARCCYHLRMASVPRTPERLARGKYLVQGILSCEVCHTPSDWTQHGAPQVLGMELSGQTLTLAGFPGTAVAPNITPDPETGAGNWTDDQIARAIREGIKRDGTTI